MLINAGNKNSKLITNKWDRNGVPIETIEPTRFIIKNKKIFIYFKFKKNNKINLITYWENLHAKSNIKIEQFLMCL